MKREVIIMRVELNGLVRFMARATFRVTSHTSSVSRQKRTASRTSWRHSEHRPAGQLFGKRSNTIGRRMVNCGVRFIRLFCQGPHALSALPRVGSSIMSV